MEPQRVQIGANEFSAIVRAGSPTVLFLHGLAGHSGEWVDVASRLSPSVGLIIPDQRAHGSTWLCGTTEVRADAYVADAAALIERFAKDKVIVVGQSMGGIVATFLAHSRPDLVSRLVLIETGMAAMSDAAFTHLERWFDTWPESFADRAEAAEFFGPDKRSTPAWIDGLEETDSGLVKRFDPSVMVETMRTLATTSRLPEWRSINVPTTLVVAPDSAIDEADIAEMLEAKPDTELFVSEDSGHDVHLDQPAQVAKLLAERLANQAYNDSAARFRQLVGSTVNDQFENEEDQAALASFAKSISQKEGLLIDAGCGTGRVAALLAPDGNNVLGIDIAPGMIAEARTAHPQIPFKVAPLTAIPVADSTAAAVAYWYSIITTSPEDLPAVWNELSRVLAIGGHALVAFLCGGGDAVVRTNAYGTGSPITLYRHDPQFVSRTLGQAGMAVDTVSQRAPVFEHEDGDQAIVRCSK